LLLIPTGGISSPFIWYALNPVLTAASILTPLFCWGILTFYLGSATLIANRLFLREDMLKILDEKSYFYLVCLLTTLLVSLFSGLTKELDSKASLLKEQQENLLHLNKQLTETNEKYQETLEHIMSLYQVMDKFSSKKSPSKLINEVTAHLIKCTQSNAAFFWLKDINHHNSLIANSTENTDLAIDLKKEWNTIRRNIEPFAHEINNELYWMKIIRTSNNVGVLGVKVSSCSEAKKTFLLSRTFEFLAELSEIMLERIYMDQVMDQMIVIEEQNRIANEIHDSVSQRLFGIVYSLHSLQMKSENITSEELNYEYKFLSQSANTTMKELRSAIYRLSSVKKGVQPFFVRLKKYLEDYARLNDVVINYQITGDESLISTNLKEELYRIICEACGNAVRHGQCNNIQLKLSILADKTVFSIHDNGIGIHSPDERDKKDKGIGLINMQNIVSAFSGTFSIQGISGFGTEIQIEIPTIKMLKKQEVL
jgi:signal transduction histidine kinase